ncbi:MAG: aspartate aminotransferase family protein [Thermodesulfobacteriota bacterium]|nr:aspartate aminotransferase family protein [Thermodesulfobacteriota bacterium]
MGKDEKGKGFLDPSSETARLYAEASKYIPGGTSRIHYYFSPYPIYAQSGEGCHLTDVEGTKRLDFLNNMTALIHGHGNPAIKKALFEQIERGTAFSEPSEPEVRLARLMIERVKSLQKIRFSNSGTEAVMMAIKLARAYTGRSRIAKFEGFYHGYYDYVQVSFSSTPANWGPAEAPASTPSSGGLADSVLGDVLVMPFNDQKAVERLLERHGRSIAALGLDPLSNKGGFPLPAEGFFKFLREITRFYGILTIYDEVISFRVDSGGAQGKYGGDPDLTTFGKIMGGGLPVGAVGGKAEVMDLLDPSQGSPRVISGGTASANPLTMAAGLAAMEQMTSPVYARINRLGDLLRKKANEVFAAAGEPAQLTGEGSLFRLLMTDEPITDYRTSIRKAAPQERFNRLHRNLLDEGVIISKEGLACLSTPMGEAEVDQFVKALERAVAKLQKG